MQLNNIFAQDDCDDEECMDETQHDVMQVINGVIVADQIIEKDMSIDI